MAPGQAELSDIEFVDRRQDVRVIVNIPGRFSLANRRDARGERRVFDCRVVNLSVRGIGVVCSTTAPAGERVMLRLDHFGEIQGIVGRVLEGGFMMNIVMSGDDREKLALKIEWFENLKNHDVGERRADARFAPTNPHSQLMWSDGKSETCHILDLSTSGAAILSDTTPAMGAVLAVGKVVGRVARRFRGGFAVQFKEAQSRAKIEEKVAKA
jgi:PilZ domain-containing protein